MLPMPRGRALYGTEPFQFDACVGIEPGLQHALNGGTTLCGIEANEARLLGHPWTLAAADSCEDCRRGYAVDVLDAAWMPGPVGTGAEPRRRVGPPEPFPAIVQGKVSRRKRVTGDLYALTLTSGGFLGVRIADDDATVGGMDGMYVVYLYEDQASDLQDLPALCVSVDALLMPPLIINRSPWTYGYMTYVGPVERCPGELLTRHVFQHRITKRYYDAQGLEVPKPPRSQPVGECSVTTGWGLALTVEAKTRPGSAT